MKKITKNLIFALTIFLLIFCGISRVFAASHYVYTVGSKYDDSGAVNSDSRATAIWAGNYFEGMGYTKKILPLNNGTHFTDSDLKSKINIIRSWIQADITYYVGHANYDNMSWKYNNNTGVCLSADGGSITGYNCVNLKGYNLNNTRLAVFMGCKTASTNNSIYKVASNLGAKSTVGWSTNIPAPETTNWTKRFLGKLVVNKTVQQSVDYANSFTYTYPDIKNTKVLGGSTLVPLASNLSLSQNYNTNNLDTFVLENDEREYIINQELDENKPVEESLGKIIRKFVNKDFINDDYILMTSESNFDEKEITKIYDLYFKLNDIRTNIGYTIFVKDNIVTAIYDNMNNNDTNSLKESNISNELKMKVNSLSKDKKDKMKQKVLYNNNYMKKIIKEEDIYNVEENKTYYIILYEEIDTLSNTISMDYYREEI